MTTLSILKDPRPAAEPVSPTRAPAKDTAGELAALRIQQREIEGRLSAARDNADYLRSIASRDPDATWQKREAQTAADNLAFKISEELASHRTMVAVVERRLAGEQAEAAGREADELEREIGSVLPKFLEQLIEYNNTCARLRGLRARAASVEGLLRPAVAHAINSPWGEIGDDLAELRIQLIVRALGESLGDTTHLLDSIADRRQVLEAQERRHSAKLRAAADRSRERMQDQWSAPPGLMGEPTLLDKHRKPAA